MFGTVCESPRVLTASTAHAGVGAREGLSAVAREGAVARRLRRASRERALLRRDARPRGAPAAALPAALARSARPGAPALRRLRGRHPRAQDAHRAPPVREHRHLVTWGLVNVSLIRIGPRQEVIMITYRYTSTAYGTPRYSYSPRNALHPHVFQLLLALFRSHSFPFTLLLWHCHHK